MTNMRDGEETSSLCCCPVLVRDVTIEANGVRDMWDLCVISSSCISIYNDLKQNKTKQEQTKY